MSCSGTECRVAADVVVSGIEAVQTALDEGGKTVVAGIDVDDELNERGQQLTVPLQLLVPILCGHR